MEVTDGGKGVAGTGEGDGEGDGVGEGIKGVMGTGKVTVARGVLVGGAGNGVAVAVGLITGGVIAGSCGVAVGSGLAAGAVNSVGSGVAVEAEGVGDVLMQDSKLIMSRNRSPPTLNTLKHEFIAALLSKCLSVLIIIAQRSFSQ